MFLGTALILGGCSEKKIISIAPDTTAKSEENVTKETPESKQVEETKTAVRETENAETVLETEQKTVAEETFSETEWVSASTPVTNDSYEVITKYLKDLGFVPTMWSDTWDNWLYVIDDHHANLILIEDPKDFSYGNYMLFVAVPLSCDQKVHWDDAASVASLANEAERLEKDVLYELLTEEEVKEVIASYAR
jgi:hypothetical protein